MASLILSGSTSGSVTLSSPAVSGTTTLTLPTTSGTVITSASSLTASQLPSGSVIGFGQTYLTTQKTTTSTSYVTTGLEITYTKKVSSSYVLVLATPTLQPYKNSAGNAQLAARIYDSTNSREIYDFKMVWRSYDSGNANLISGPCTLQAVDTNSGTGSRTYRVDFKLVEGLDARINLDTSTDTASSITVWEIAQ